MPASEDNVDGHTPTFWIRVDAVIELIVKNRNYLQSKRTESLVTTVMNQLNVESRQAKEYIKYAKKGVKIHSTGNLAKVKESAILDREALLLEVKDDPKLKLEIMKDRDNIKGVYVNKIDHNVEISLKNIDIKNLPETFLQRIANGENPQLVISEYNAIKQHSNTGNS